MAEDVIKQVVVVRKDLNMRKGKIAAQVGHASMEFLLRHSECEPRESGAFTFKTVLRPIEVAWLARGRTKITAYVNSEDELKDLIGAAIKRGIVVCPVVDAGKTEFGGVSTLTCVAFGPELASVLDDVTSHLPLL